MLLCRLCCYLNNLAYMLWGSAPQENELWGFLGSSCPVPSRYKDGNLICQAAEPGKYLIESKYGVHTLQINR